MAQTIGDVMVKVGLNTSEFNQGLQDMGQKMGNVGKQLTMKLTAPLAALGIGSFKMAGDFDQSFRRVNVMLRASAEESRKYKAAILALSNETGKSAKDITDAYFGIVSAGYRGADSIDILTTAVEGSEIGRAHV